MLLKKKKKSEQVFRKNQDRKKVANCFGFVRKKRVIPLFDIVCSVIALGKKKKEKRKRIGREKEKESESKE